MISDQIGDGEVVFMADARHHRDRKFCKRAANVVVVEHHQVFAAPTSSCQNKGIRLKCWRCFAKFFKHRVIAAGHISLHGNGDHHELG